MVLRFEYSSSNAFLIVYRSRSINGDAVDCKSAVVMARLVRSQDTPPNLDWWRSWLAHMPVTHGVAGSSPVQSARTCRVSSASVTHTTRSSLTATGGSSKGLHPVMGMENLLRRKPQLNQTGVSNTRAVPVGKRVEGSTIYGFIHDVTIITAGGRQSFASIAHLVRASS